MEMSWQKSLPQGRRPVAMLPSSQHRSQTFFTHRMLATQVLQITHPPSVFVVADSDADPHNQLDRHFPSNLHSSDVSPRPVTTQHKWPGSSTSSTQPSTMRVLDPEPYPITTTSGRGPYDEPLHSSNLKKNLICQDNHHAS